MIARWLEVYHGYYFKNSKKRMMIMQRVFYSLGSPTWLIKFTIVFKVMVIFVSKKYMTIIYDSKQKKKNYRISLII